MKDTVHHLDEPARRRRQTAIGLVIQAQTNNTTPHEQNDTMQENTTTHTSKPSRAEQALRHLTTTPTFKEVAIYELKKAAVWAPIMATTLVGAFWVNKRFFIKAATGL